MIDADKARAILNEIASDEWGRPILDHLAAQWAIARISELEGLCAALSRMSKLQSRLLMKKTKKRMKKK